MHELKLIPNFSNLREIQEINLNYLEDDTMSNLTTISKQETVIFELNNESVFDTALATCQHSIVRS